MTREPIVLSFVLLFALAALAFPHSAQALSLREAMATAYATHPQIEAARANLRSIDEEVAKANAGWRPTLSIGGVEGFQHIVTDQPTHLEQDQNLLTGTATLSEPLYRGGRTVAEIRRANALVRAGRAQLTDTEQNVLLNAAIAYMDVVRDSGALEYRRNNLQVLQGQLDAGNTQLRAGAVTQTDVQQTEARLAGARAALSIAEGQLATSRARFGGRSDARLKIWRRIQTSPLCRVHWRKPSIMQLRRLPR